MQPIDDGGPAFPGFSYEPGSGCCKTTYGPDGQMHTEVYVPGMSLRDYFAAKAMLARIIAAFSCWDQDAIDERAKLGSKIQEITALAAYTYADAMLAARQHKE